MTTVDEALADPRAALGLSDTDIPVNIIIMAEFVTLDDAEPCPDRRRLAMMSSDELEPWTSIGMLRMGQMREMRTLDDDYDFFPTDDDDG